MGPDRNNGDLLHLPPRVAGMVRDARQGGSRQEEHAADLWRC